VNTEPRKPASSAPNGRPSHERVAVIGAGTMGRSIAVDALRAGRAVALHDRDAEVLSKAWQEIASTIERLQVSGLSGAWVNWTDRLRLTSKLEEAVADVDWVIEAVPEDLRLKHVTLGALEALCPPEVILASNSSTLMPSRLAEPLKHPGRLVVAHFWNPAHLVPLVEIVPHEGTAARTTEWVRAELEQWGKRAIVLRRETPGFVGNRLAFALQREAMSLVAQGVASPEEIDAVVRWGFGRRIPFTGVFRTADLGGLDVYAAISALLFPDLSRATDVPAPLADLVARGHLGMKSGEGWYRYEAGEIDAWRERVAGALLSQLRQDETASRG
jgi:3-hydroxybutyryl-CoA dehydrogenase